MPLFVAPPVRLAFLAQRDADHLRTSRVIRVAFVVTSIRRGSWSDPPALCTAEFDWKGNLVSSDTNVVVDESMPAQEVRRVPGEPGLWVFLLGDMVVFGFFFVAFLMERAAEPEQFTASREALGLTIGLTNTMILLSSSLLVVVALNALRLGRNRLASRLYLAALGCGVVFSILKISEYVHMINSGHGPEVDAYYMWFFILTGTHLFHVVIGLVVLWAMFTRARDNVQLIGTHRLVFEGGSCYWHLVDLLWMVLFPLVYLAV